MRIKETGYGSNAYLRLHANDDTAMLYQDPFWFEILEASINVPIRLLGVYDGDELKAAMPFAVSQGGKLGPVVNSLPFFGSIGGLVSAETGENKAELLVRLIEELLIRAEAFKALACNVICRPGDPLEAVYRQTIQPDCEDLRTAYIFEIPAFETEKDLEQRLMTAFSNHRKRAIRKAAKQQFNIAKTDSKDDYQTFYALHCHDMNGKGGSPKPDQFWKAVEKRISSQHTELWIAKDEQRIIAGILFFIHRDTAEYYMTALHPEYRKLQPQSLLIYSAMIDFAKRNIRQLNFGGTWPSQNGLARFKSEWGAKPIPYRYFNKILRNHADLLAEAPDELLNHYPYFYVIPFNQFPMSMQRAKDDADGDHP